ncbi:U-box domain-containing protein 9 isoform X1 [Prunus yedoensis var. nudiflora]|uniref:RING-type E3 ubiquitin transferase n=1 Tax=Prunus yedoensis var. nudiflora TaxID=2094558 RepID=A0A314ZAH1_PRUYE|nr:U-box domain-containing protein 9 isoform X1 [Prunus yedoensis var. nudiflora]
MAKTGVFDSDPAMVAKATELKKELQRLVRAIVDDEDFSTQTIDQAKDTLSALKELKFKKRSLSLKLNDVLSCPPEFRCPLSKELMRDPVIVSTGETYDRPFIQKGLKAGNRICPRTQQVLSHTILTPNHLVREMISQWCKNRGIELSDPVLLVNEDGITESDRDHFLSLLQKMSSGLPDQKEAAKELRLLTKRMPSFRALFGESILAIPQLLSPLSEGKFEDGIHPELQEDVITTLLNLSIHDNNKKLVAESPMVIPLLIEALQSGTIQTRSNAAAALFTLSALDSNKALIGKSGALKPLIALLDEGHPLAMKDVASAIFNLCITHENKARAVRDGAVRTILKKISNRMHVDELLAILAMLSSHPKAVEEMGELGAVPCLLRVIRETNCGRNKENCIAVLHTICLNDRTKWKEIREEENTYGTISELAQNGTSRSKGKLVAFLID